MPSMSPGRAGVRYSDALGAEICARVARGESVRALSQEPGMPSRRCFDDWARRDPVFGQALAAAKLKARRARVAGDRAAEAAGRGWRRMLSRAGQRGGSVSILTPEITEAVCARIAAGQSVLAIGADPAMPGAVSIYNWARWDATFREAYLRAKDVGLNVMFDVAREIALECTEDTVRSDGLRVRTLHWQVALQAPKKYGGRGGPKWPIDDDDGPAEGQGSVIVVMRGRDGSYRDVDGNPIPTPAWDAEEDWGDDAPAAEPRQLSRD